VFLPKGTPEPIVRRLNAAFSDALDTPTAIEQLHKIGIDIAPKERRDPAYAGRFVASEIEKYAGPIKASGIAID